MPPPCSTVRTCDVLGELEGLLDALCTQPSIVHLCKVCGSKKVNLDATIFLADSEHLWNVLLPVCPQCDRAEYLKLKSRPAA